MNKEQTQIKDFYNTLKRIRDEEPWDTMNPNMIMEIEMPGQQLPCYGIFFTDHCHGGMGIHMGENGLNFLEMLNRNNLDCDELLWEFYLDAYQIHFIPCRELANPADMIMVNGRVRPAEDNLVPALIRTEPCRMPHMPKGEELIELAWIVQQMLRGYLAVKADDELLECVKRGDLLRLDKEESPIQINSHIRKRPITEKLSFPQIQMDELTIARYNKDIYVKNSQWKMALSPMPTSFETKDGVQDSPKILLTAIDRKTGRVVIKEAVSIGVGITGVADAVMRILRKHGISRTVCCKPGLLDNIFSNVLRKPEVKVIEQDDDEYKKASSAERNQVVSMLLDMPDKEFERRIKAMPKAKRAEMKAIRQEFRRKVSSLKIKL